MSDDFDDFPETHLEDDDYDEFVKKNFGSGGGQKGDPPMGLWIGLICVVVLVFAVYILS